MKITKTPITHFLDTKRIKTKVMRTTNLGCHKVRMPFGFNFFQQKVLCIMDFVKDNRLCSELWKSCRASRKRTQCSQQNKTE